MKTEAACHGWKTLMHTDGTLFPFSLLPSKGRLFLPLRGKEKVKINRKLVSSDGIYF